MEIKKGQIWKRINMDEFFKVVHVSGSDIHLNHLGVRNVSLVTEAVLKANLSRIKAICKKHIVRTW